MELNEVEEFETSQIYRLPLEIQFKLFSFVDKKSLLALRQVSRTCRDVIHFARLLSFSSCTLSDSTAKYVLTSVESVDKILIRHFTKISSLLPNRKTSVEEAVLRDASEVVFGKSILPQNLRIILKQLKNVKTICLDTPFHCILEGFMSSKLTFEHLSTLVLYIGNRKYELDFLRTFALEVKGNLKFPNLQVFNFRWNQRELRQIRNDPSVYRMYLSLHKIAWNHRSSLKAINWNLHLNYSKTDLIHLGSLDGSQEFLILKRLMSQMPGLKNVQIGLIDLEGHDNWNLSEGLIKSQRELININLKPLTTYQNIESGLLLLRTIAEKNSNSLVKLEISSGNDHHTHSLMRFSFNSLIECHSLKELRLNYFQYVIDTFIHIPLGITTLSLGLFDSPRDVEMLDWILNNLKKLKSFDLLLGMSSWMTSTYFKSIISSLPELELLYIKAFGILQKTLRLWKICCNGKTGVKARIKKNICSYKYELNCSIDRSNFKGFAH